MICMRRLCSWRKLSEKETRSEIDLTRTRERDGGRPGGGGRSSTSFASFNCQWVGQNDSEYRLEDVVVVVAVVDEGRALWEGGR